MLRFGHLSRALTFRRPSLRTAVNVAVTFGLAYALYRQFFVVNHLPTLYIGFRQNLPSTFAPWIAAIAALMPVNLLLEAYKLRVALPRNLQTSWRDTLGQVCAGIAVGLWTPGRIGEFAGRLARTRNEQRGAILSATALGGIAQWSPLLVGGGVAVLLWQTLPELNLRPEDAWPDAISRIANATAAVDPSTGADEYPMPAVGTLPAYLGGEMVSYLGVTSVFCGLGAGLLFWRITAVIRYLRQQRRPTWTDRMLRATGVAALAPGAFLRVFERRRGGLLTASVGRYVVYLLQMSAAFVAFGLPTALPAAIVGTATLLLLHGFLPVPPALQAVARIEFAVYLFAYCQPNEVSIAAASLFVFALNLGVPALIGWLFIIRRNDASVSL